MPKGKLPRKVMFGVFAIFFLAVSGFAVLSFSSTTVQPTSNPPVPPDDQKTTIAASPTPYTYPTPVQTQNGYTTPKPTAKTPTPTANTPITTVWQSLFITNKDGTNYWANAPKPFNLASIFGSSDNDNPNFNLIQSMQNNIYMNIAESGVSSWSFSCQETMKITDQQGNLVKNIVSGSSVNANGQNAPANQNLWVTGASLTSSQLEQVLNLPQGSYVIVITLANINLQLTVNGQTQSLSAVNPSANVDNTLTWKIMLSN